MLSLFNFRLWFPVLVFALVYTILSAAHAPIGNKFFSRIERFFWFYLSSLVTSPISIPRDKVGQAVVWLVSVFVLQQYFTSDLLAHMTATPPDVVIDSWPDLAETELKIYNFLAESNVKDVDVEKYAASVFPKKSEFFEEFKKRLVLLPSWRYTDLNNRLEIFSKLCEKPDFVVLANGMTLMYSVNYLANGAFRNKIHVSSSGGDFMPVFFSTGVSASDRKRNVIHFV